MEYWPRFSPQELEKFAIVKYGGKDKRKQLSERSLGAKYQFFDFSSFLQRRLISTEEDDFYEGG